MRQRRPRAWVLILLGLGLLLLALLIWLGLGFWGQFRGQASGSWQDPLLQTRSDRIVPRLALMGLAGWPDQQVVEAALSEGAWETAYAALVYSTQIADRERAGLWLSLGRGLAKAGEAERAVLCYKQVETIVALSPVLSDYLRADDLSQAALGLAQVGQAGLADRLAEETLVLARGSPDLRPVLRQQLVERVAEVYRLLGDETRRHHVLGLLARESLESPGGAGEGNQGTLLPSLETSVEMPEIVTQAVRERQAVALRLAQSAVPGLDTGSAEGRLMLARALQREDAVWTEELSALQKGEVRLAVRAGLAKKKVEWLTLKYRAARGDYGLSLVPEWEEQVHDIRSSLARAYQELYTLYKDEVVGLPTVEEVRQGWVEVLKEEAKAGRLGLYPNYPEQQVAENLSHWTEEWLKGHPEVYWRISVVEREGGLDYVLVER